MQLMLICKARLYMQLTQHSEGGKSEVYHHGHVLAQETDPPCLLDDG